MNNLQLMHSNPSEMIFFAADLIDRCLCPFIFPCFLRKLRERQGRGKNENF